MPHSKPLIGIAAGIGAGMLWGLMFVAPQVLSSFRPVEIALGRFFFFGLISLFYARPIWALAKKLSGKELLLVTCLSACGFWIYTILTMWSVQYTGAVITTLVIGLLPVTIPLVASRMKIMSRQIFVGLSLILLGLMTLQAGPLLSNQPSFTNFSFIGALCLISCLAMWTWYGLKNSSFLKERSFISKRDFTSLIGIISFLALAIISLGMVDFQSLTYHRELDKFVIWSAIMGIGSTWLAYWLWNICSQHCPPQISGPLIVTETLFGLLFTFIYQARWPSAFESTAILLFIAGAFICIRDELKRPG